MRGWAGNAVVLRSGACRRPPAGAVRPLHRCLRSIALRVARHGRAGRVCLCKAYALSRGAAHICWPIGQGDTSFPRTYDGPRFARSLPPDFSKTAAQILNFPIIRRDENTLPNVFAVTTFIHPLFISFDLEKSEANRRKHGVSLMLAHMIDWSCMWSAPVRGKTMVNCARSVLR